MHPDRLARDDELLGRTKAEQVPGRPPAPQCPATLDNTALQWHYVTCQGIAFALLLQWLPRWPSP